MPQGQGDVAKLKIFYSKNKSEKIFSKSFTLKKFSKCHSKGPSQIIHPLQYIAGSAVLHIGSCAISLTPLHPLNDLN